MPHPSCFVSWDHQIFDKKMPGTAEYVYNLDVRQTRLVNPDPSASFTPRPTHLSVANMHFEGSLGILGTPEKLMDFSEKGHLSKLDLAALLSSEKRIVYLDACARFERALTQACAAKGDFCLESRCAFEEEEGVCLNAVLEAGDVYTTGCVSLWKYFFVNSENRIPVWRN